MEFVLAFQHNLEGKGAETRVQGMSGPERNQLGERMLELAQEAEQLVSAQLRKGGCFVFMDSQSAQHYNLCFFVQNGNWKQLVMYWR